MHHLPAAFQEADWIWLREEKDNQYATFRCMFESDVEKGVLYISADSDYALGLNQRLCAFNQYDDHPMHKSYDTVNCTLKKGENVVTLHVWHQSSKGCYTYIPGPAGVKFAIAAEDGRALCKSEAGMPCRPQVQYKVGDIEPISGQLGDGFHYDASVPDAVWEEAVTVEARRDTALYPRPVKKLELKDPVLPEMVKFGLWQPQGGDTAAQIAQYAKLDTDAGDGYVIYDLGREECGLLHLKVRGKAGDSVIIAWGEHMDGGRVRAYVDGRHFATRYTLHDGENVFTHYFRRLGARYLMVLSEGDVLPYLVTLIPTEYPVKCVSDFDCADQELKKIYDVSVRTLHLCMHEHYEDTPWREQALYAMDSRNQALFGYCCFGERDFPAAYLDLFREGIREDHLFELCAHAKERFTIPSFTLSWVLAVRDHLLWTGQCDTARRMLPTVKEIVDGFMDRICENGLCMMPGSSKYWNFYEWTDGMDDQDIFQTKEGDQRPQRADAALNLYLILAMEAEKEICLYLGEAWQREDAIRSLRRQVKKHFYDAEKEAIRTHPDERHFTEFNQALALLANVLESDEACALRGKLCDPDSGFVPVSLSCSLMKYQALLMDSDRYGTWVIGDIKQKWGRMLQKGATSFWEVEEGADAYDFAGSLCHGWSAVPVYVLTVYGLGVQPAAPGFSEYTFTPCKEISASGVVPTPLGGIRVRDGRIEMVHQIKGFS
ncbi:MAG: hypothetical protein E7326_04220 [Clostridiales bacterium]|nr:hypothetical protein [Clostridiales bacterium]